MVTGYFVNKKSLILPEVIIIYPIFVLYVNIVKQINMLTIFKIMLTIGNLAGMSVVLV
jgi:hypothetical protein